MTDDEVILRETTQPTISGHLLGIGNIFERELPDEHGVVGPRLSANLSIQELATKREWTQKVFVGSLLTLGADRYSVLDVEEGETAPGSITLRQLS